jgi:hypothetical protein
VASDDGAQPRKREAARGRRSLFLRLRELDNSGADEIIAEPLHEHGLGIAMMDRLRRAAAKF